LTPESDLIAHGSKFRLRPIHADGDRIDERESLGCFASTGVN
jgi:hypothetical protein